MQQSYYMQKNSFAIKLKKYCPQIVFITDLLSKSEWEGSHSVKIIKNKK